MPLITFQFENGESLQTEAQLEETVLHAARRAGVAIDAPCSGNGTCGKCRVRVLSGTAVSQPSRHITREDYAGGWRLACSTTISGDVTVLVPETASAFRSNIRTADLNDPSVRHAFDDVQGALTAAGIPETASVRVISVETALPSLEDTMPDNERVLRAVSSLLNTGNVSLSLHALKKLPTLLRENGFRFQAVVEQLPAADTEPAFRIMDVLPEGDTAPVCGLSIDIGTTTVTGVLSDFRTGELLSRASAGNGQIRYGADVINRIIESTRPGGSERLRKAVTEETLLPLIRSLCRSAGVPMQRVYRTVIAGNTTMTHLLLGLYADPIRREPYVPCFFDAGPLPAEEVLPGLCPGSFLLIAPNVGSYVGGDITAGTLASLLWNRPEVTLFIDLGTNGELVLGNEDFQLCCACSAGPAFEGGDISCGMRATDGAIEELHIDRATLEPRYSVIGDPGQKPIGLCGSGLLDTVAELFLSGVIDARGKFHPGPARVRFDENGMGAYCIAAADESADGREICINEVDLDNFIRAKGAIFSAICLMLGYLDMEVNDVSSILIAGGIGGGIDFEHAVTIGMLPDVPRDRFRFIGNTSLAGAFAMMQRPEAVRKVRSLAGNMTYVELSNAPGYMDEFVGACFLPHTDGALFPSVADKLKAKE